MLRHILAKSETSILIGAMDGVSFDDIGKTLPICPHMKKVVMVEPIPWHFNALKSNFSKYLNCVFEEAAITSVAGKVTMIAIPPWKYSEVPDWSVGCSMIGDHFKTERGTNLLRDEEKIEAAAVHIEVNAITFPDLLKKHDLTTVDFIKIDTEGHDWIILQQIDLATVNPMAVFFEAGHLSDETKEIVIRWFNDHSYDYYAVGDGSDGCAIRRNI